MTSGINRWIELGGVIPAECMNELCEKLADAGCGEDWGCSFNDARKVRDAIEAFLDDPRTLKSHGRLFLCTLEAHESDYALLTAWLRANGMHYITGVEPGSQSDGWVEHWSPGMLGSLYFEADNSGVPLVNYEWLIKHEQHGTLDELMDRMRCVHDRRIPRLSIVGPVGRLAMPSYPEQLSLPLSLQ